MNRWPLTQIQAGIVSNTWSGFGDYVVYQQSSDRTAAAGVGPDTVGAQIGDLPIGQYLDKCAGLQFSVSDYGR